MKDISEASYIRMELSTLRPADYNPRDITDDALVGLENTIDQFGLVQPIVWNRGTGNIVGGHQRYKVLVSRGVREAMVAVVDLPEAQEKALNVALNNPHTMGHFKNSDLQSLLAELRTQEPAIYVNTHIDKLFAETVLGEVEEDGEAEEIVPISKVGDLWLLGEHRLLCGDSTDHGSVMRLIGDESAQCMWTDPPDGVSYTGKTADALTIQNDGKETFQRVIGPAFTIAHDYVLRPNAGVYVAYASSSTIEFWTALMGAGFKYRQELVWAKQTMVLGRMDYHYKHEPIWYGFKPGDATFGRALGAKREVEGWFGGDNQTTVFEYDKPSANADHPTMKPVALVEAMIINSSRVGDWVYDPFSGSGSTLMACANQQRRCLAIELEPKYCDAIVRRWETMTGAKATLDSQWGH